MLPIIIKDLFENLKTWVLFATAAALSSILASGDDKAQLVRGFTQALAYGSTLIFAYTVVFSERKRRHLVFLKSLPITDSRIVAAKFIAVLVLTLTLSAVPCVSGLVMGGPSPPCATILVLSLVTLYASLVLSLYICFRNPALPFLPLYTAALILVWSETKPPDQLPSGSAATLLLSLLASVLIYRVTLVIFRRKELDF